MAAPRSSPRRLIIILDPEFGERLRAMQPGIPIWIELSPTNEPTVRALWVEHPEPSHLLGITGLKFEPSVRAEERLLGNMDMIELHHGPHSASEPYTELEVIGCDLSPSIRMALGDLGFDRFEELEQGFLARRAPEQAAIRR
ncbi:hypothetical protein [Dongia sedimenti]|uniref:Uncharacterized protein n=1 Tax=Dongia sedimenti TaxID=3064282 RepID=A0ABU0YP18_9PROT|nr:hypothetical protein [Rhodospirillaceae bacterium R-7]